MAGDTAAQYTLTDMRNRLWLAIQHLYLHDYYLIKHQHWEGTISHRLAVYVEQGFAGWHVDCEFNKDGEGPKLARESRKSKRPDIIVHKRGKKGPNLLAIELKKEPHTGEYDRKKARHYIKELGYTWAVCIRVGPDQAWCEWQGEGVPEGSLDELLWRDLKEHGREY